MLVYVTFISVNASVIALRLRDPGRPRRFAIPFTIRGVPVTAALGLVTIAFVSVFLHWESIVIGLGILGVGAAVWLVRRRAVIE